MNTQSSSTAGIAFLVLGMVAISLNDLVIKLLSGDYPLHQMTMTRSVIGLGLTLFLVKWEGGWAILKTRTPGLHTLRCLLIVVSNLTYFTALSVVPLATATALFFVAPLFITLMSIPLLGERVGPVRMIAVTIGFCGVLIMFRPWAAEGEREASLLILSLPVLAAATYAGNQVLTRKLGATSKASALAVYIQVMFIIVSALIYLVAGDGRYAAHVDAPSLIFLLRAWIWPEGRDLWLFLALGANSAVVGYALSQAYRLSTAATLAPFEYVGLPMAIIWGLVVFGTFPGVSVWIGMILIAGSGLFVFLREHQKKRVVVSAQAVKRR